MVKSNKPLVLIADDDPDILKLLTHCLQSWGYRVDCAENKTQLLERLFDQSPSLLLLDLIFGEHNGIEILNELLRQDPALTVVLLTAHGTIDSAVTAIKFGAYDYLTKPLDLNRLQVVVARAVEKHGLANRIQQLQKLVDEPQRPILGTSAAISHLREIIASVAATDATVLILGESGTGKELVARGLHEQSPRRLGPFIPLNMAALPRELVESTLFGHEQGAFTGADSAQKGCCEMADGGTLFLDEIGEMEVGLQSKLLRFLQEQTVQRVGASKARRVDVRIVAATNRNPRELVQQGQLREDLYYRLNVVPIELPPLRQRREDVAVLAMRFLHRASARLGKYVTGFQPQAMELLTAYDWPGNVRQLENLVERLAIFARESEISLAEIPAEIAYPRGAPLERSEPMPTPSPAAFSRPAVIGNGNKDPNLTAMEQMERTAILDALQKSGGHVADAARLLGLGQATVYRKIKRYGITVEKRRRGEE